MITFSLLSLFFPFVAIFGFIFTGVSAHGYIHSITLDGVTYQGADPYGSAIASPIRQVSSNSPASPVYGNINGVAMACGGDAKAASMTVPVTAGSDVSVYWGSWPHNVGPMMTYLGKCEGSCTTTDPTKINFFKIHQVDFVPGTHTWVQSQTLYKGLPFNFTLPEDLPNGDFIMRHEVIALHNAMNQGGAEIFPQCIQINVDCGSGKIPTATAKFPGGYSARDPGILINVYDDPNNIVYTFPGPVLALEEDPEEDEDPSSTSATSTPPTTSTSTSTPSSSSTAPTSTSSSVSSTTTDSASSSASITSTSSSSSSSSSATDSSSSSSSPPSSTATSSSTSPSETASSTDSASASTTSATDASTTSPATSSTKTRTKTKRPSTTTSQPTSTSSSSSSSQTSTTSTTPAADPTESVSMDLQNGRDAIALNHKYQSIVAGSSCPNYEIGCIGDAFAQCVWGTWVSTKCPVGTVCAALPNVGTPGTSIACTTPADRDMRIAITGATLKMKRHRKLSHLGHGRH
ncbi:hypothetical protein FRB90_002794 [Tulasnella sp. 427]|nr:hypothetical protein FRB90_002794 [Tulasnella sp. 427]